MVSGCLLLRFLQCCRRLHKNWLFSDTPKGAEASATVYTMGEMARAHGLNIYKYLMERLPCTKMNDGALSKLAPWDQDVIASFRCNVETAPTSDKYK